MKVGINGININLILICFNTMNADCLNRSFKVGSMDWKVQYDPEEREELFVFVYGFCNQKQFLVFVSNSPTFHFTKDMKKSQFSTP